MDHFVMDSAIILLQETDKFILMLTNLDITKCVNAKCLQMHLFAIIPTEML